MTALLACDQSPSISTGTTATADGNSGNGLRTARPQSEPRQLTDFALVDHQQRDFNRAALINHWTLMFFGFTRCPDICPPTLSQLSALQQRMTQAGEQPPQLIFVTVDPEVDQPQVLADYLSSFDGDIIGVTGDSRQIGALTTQLGIFNRIRPGAGHDHHDRHHTDVDHSGTILMIDPQARHVASFIQLPESPADLEYDLRQLMQPES